MKNPVSVVVLNDGYPEDLQQPCPWSPCGTAAVFILELTLLELPVTISACATHLSKLKCRIFENLETATKEGKR